MLPLRRVILSCAAAAFAVLGTPPAAAKLDLDRIAPVPETESIPVIDFFREPIMKNPTVNLDGTHVAATISSGADHTVLMVYDLKTKRTELFGTRGDTDIENVTWLSAKRLIFTITVKKIGGFIMAAGEVGSISNSYPLIQNAGARLLAVPPKDRDHPLVWEIPNTENTGKYGAVVTVNAQINSGKFLDISGNGALLRGEQIDIASETNQRHTVERHPVFETPNGFLNYYMADREGKLAFCVSSTDGVFALHRLEGEAWKDCPFDLDQVNIIGASDNPGEVVALGPRDGTKPRPLEFMNATTGQPGEVLLQDPAYDFNGWLYRDPATQAIVGAIYDRAGPHVVWFTEAYGKLQAAVDQLFPGMVVRILGSDEGGKIVLLSVSSDRQSPIYRWVDLTTRQAGDIQSSRPWLDPKRMQPMSVIKFKTRDGRKLDAYVTMPAGASKANPPPLIVLPHPYNGGRSTWGFSPEVQFYASRGYAVLQPNRRGSAGYSWMFTEADEWDYRAMANDVIDATKMLAKSGLVDAHRVGIVGTGFGGYLALAAAAFDPDLYQCAIGISPVCDWGDVIKERKYSQYSNPYYSRMTRKLGDPDKEPAKFDAMSPLHHAGAIKAAVLISTSEYDASDVIHGARELAAEVRSHGVPAETISFTNEAEGVWHLDHKVELYTKIESFLAEHLGGAKSK